MKTYSFEIPIFDYDVKLIQIEGKKDYAQIKKHEWLKDIPDEDKEEIFQQVKDDACDGACALRNLSMKQFVVVFYKFESEEKRVNVYAHEKRHVEDRIMEYLHIEDFETAGYLAGFLAVEFNKFIKQKIMKERVIKNLNELNKALEEDYTEFSTRGLLNHSYHITFGEEEDIYEVYDLADDKTVIMSVEDINERFEKNFTDETFIAEE